MKLSQASCKKKKFSVASLLLLVRRLKLLSKRVLVNQASKLAVIGVTPQSSRCGLKEELLIVYMMKNFEVVVSFSLNSLGLAIFCL